MSSSFDHLTVFAEVSAAIVGFVAIFLVLVRREDKFPPEDAIRIRALILVGFAGIFMSLLPIALSRGNFSIDEVWVISSVVFIVILASASAYVAVKHFQLSDDAREQIPLGNLLIAWTCAGIAGVLLASNVVDAPIFGYSFSYTSALLLILAAGATNFYTIAIQKLL
jgi:hypothetical protein